MGDALSEVGGAIVEACDISSIDIEVLDGQAAGIVGGDVGGEVELFLFECSCGSGEISRSRNSVVFP